MRLSFTFLMMAVCWSLGGCAVLDHLDQMMTLSDYARDKEAQEKTINRINAHYDALVKAITSGEIKKYANQLEVRRAFGEPILIKAIESDGQHQEQWLYRYGLPTRAKDKVYLYFDAKGKLFEYKQENASW